MAEPINEAEVEEVVETVKLLIARRKAIYNMAHHYWTKLGRPFVTEPGYRIANIGAGDVTDVDPFSYGIEGKSREDLVMSIREKSQPRNVKFYNFDNFARVNWIEFIRKNPLLDRIYSNPRNYVQADATRMPAPEALFDMCLVRNPNWRDFEGEEDKARLMAELTRVLKNGGILWMTFLRKAEYLEALRLLKDNAAFQIKIHGENKYPSTRVKLASGEIEEKRPAFDSFILIAEKSQLEAAVGK